MEDSNDGNLCQVCTETVQGKTLVDKREDWHWSNIKGANNPFDRAHHKNYSSFLNSKDQGCCICSSWLWASHAPPPPTSSNVDDFRIFSRVDAYSGVNLYFCVTCPWAADSELHVSLAKAPNPDEHGAGRGDPDRPWSRIAPTLGSSQDIATIRRWISCCESEHKHCDPRRSRVNAFLPSRVIDVKNAELGVVRLRSREDLRAPGHGASYPPYWTLSHRWGDPSKILQLNKTTEARFRAGISLEGLAPTFRDAILLVHQLGHAYLWIDCLCVLQDSLADWQAEANGMVDVYRHSFCNISAAGASYDPSNTGLFSARKLAPRLLYPFTVTVSLETNAALSGQEAAPGRWMVRNKSAWADEVERAPLSSRGWVVQERFLAARILHFTRNQIYWECLESSYCATEPTRNLTTDWPSTTTKATAGYKRAGLELARVRAALAATGQPYSDPNKESRSAYSHHTHWGAIVGLYVGCVLTKESDRFLAMSGIAKAFREVNGDEYLAGLWKRMIYTDLLWHSQASAGVHARRSTELYAPSWSWASVVGGHVQLGVPHTKFGSLPVPLVRLAEARVVPEPPGGDATGLLRSAELEIECVPYYYSWDGRQKNLAVFRDEARTECYFRQTDGPASGSGSRLDLRLDTSELVERFAAADEAHGVCVPIYGAYAGCGGGSNEYLMLERDSGCRFKRIGLLRAGGIGKWISGWPEDCPRHVITLI